MDPTELTRISHTPPEQPQRREVTRHAGWVVAAIGLSAVLFTVLIAVSRNDATVPDPAPGPDGALLLGSPSNVLGQDPDNPTDQRLWLNISGRNSSTSNGDKYTSGRCSLPPVNNSVGGGTDACTTNPSYRPEGHLFAVQVANRPVGNQPLSIQVFDPAFTEVGDHCDRNLPSPEQIGALRAQYSTDDNRAAERYARGDSSFCSGDQPADGASVTTTYLVRAPDSTPSNYEDNPVVCAITFDPNSGPVFPRLDRSDPASAAPQGHEQVRFADHFRKWFPICTIPAAAIQTGTYVVQVRTNADLSDPRRNITGGLEADGGPGSLVRTDPGVFTSGANRFSLRATWPDQGSGQSPPAIAVNGIGHLAIFINKPSGTGEFSLARITSAHAGQVLRINMWDLGDIASTNNPRENGTADVEVLPPVEARGATGTPPTCQFTRDGGPALGLRVVGCQANGLSSAVYNAANLDAAVQLPSDYRCDDSSATGCWFSLRITYHGLPYDTTTWSADIDDAPPRVNNPNSTTPVTAATRPAPTERAPGSTTPSPSSAPRRTEPRNTEPPNTAPRHTGSTRPSPNS